MSNRIEKKKKMNGIPIKNIPANLKFDSIGQFFYKSNNEN